MLNGNTEAVLGEVEKSGFFLLCPTRGPQWANAPKTVWPTWRKQLVSFTVFREQGVVSSWTILGLVGFKLKLHALSISWFQPVLGPMFLWSTVFIQRSASCEQPEYVSAFIYIVLETEYGGSAMWQEYDLNC